MRILTLLILLLSAADHWTTYVCLRTPTAGWEITEANPLAQWLFGSVGLVPGLLLDSAVTVMALGFLLTTTRIPTIVKSCFLLVIAAWTAVAVLNNLNAISVIGLSLLGSA